MSSVADGVRTVTMVRSGPIPRNIDVDGFIVRSHISGSQSSVIFLRR